MNCSSLVFVKQISRMRRGSEPPPCFDLKFSSYILSRVHGAGTEEASPAAHGGGCAGAPPRRHRLRSQSASPSCPWSPSRRVRGLHRRCACNCAMPRRRAHTGNRSRTRLRPGPATRPLQPCAGSGVGRGPMKYEAARTEATHVCSTLTASDTSMHRSFSVSHAPPRAASCHWYNY